MDEATLGLSRQLLIGGLNDSLTKAYYDYMVDMAVIFGAEQSRAETELRESLNFEISLANVSASILVFSMDSMKFNFLHRSRCRWKSVEFLRVYTIR